MVNTFGLRIKMGSITPETAIAHQQLQNDVTTWLVANGWMPVDLTYHNVLPTPVVVEFQNRFAAEVLGVRDIPDLLVYRSDRDEAFWMEFKGLDVDRPNMAFEASGVLKAWHNYKFGEKTLYVLRTRTVDVGVWVWDFVTAFDKLMIPDNQKLGLEGIQRVIKFTKESMPWVKILTTGANEAGSGDPFFLARVDKIEGFLDWRDVVKQL